MIDTPKPVRVPITKFKGWQGNPRNITEREMEALQASLKKSGFVTTVVARKDSYELIGGHQRIDALHRMKDAGEKVPTHVWAIVLDLTDDQAQQLNVSLNKTGGSFDDDLLAELFAGLDVITDDDALAMGFEPDQIESLTNGLDPDLEEEAKRLEAEADELKSFARSVTLMIEFATVAERDKAKEWLKQAAEVSKIKAGEVLTKLVDAEEARMDAKPKGRRSRGAVKKVG